MENLANEIAIATGEPQVSVRYLPAAKLKLSPLNVRRTAKTSNLDELKASILAHGLMQNLVVTDGGDGKFYVIAGGRRLEAIRALQKEKKLPNDYAPPCQIVGEELAREMSLAENVARVAMHPADEFETFVGLVEDGHTVARIAERFGVTEKHVLQRLKLGKVAPELLAEYRAGSIDLEALMAFTVTDDRARQVEVYRSLHDWQRDNPHEIRSRLTEKMVTGSHKLARFVGVEEYESRGGSVRTDLFGEEVYLDDPDLLNRLAGEKFDAVRRQLEAEGWGWVEVQPEQDYAFILRCGRIRAILIDPPPELLARKEEAEGALNAASKAYESGDGADEDSLDEVLEAEAKLEDIEGQLERYVRFDPEQMKSAGCVVSLDYDGSVAIDRGLVRRPDQAKVAKGKKDAPEPTIEEEPGERIPEALRRDLAGYRLQVAQVEIASHPELAFDLLVFRVACGVLRNDLLAGPKVQFDTSRSGMPVMEPETRAAARFSEIEGGLPTKWMERGSEADRFASFRELSRAEKMALLAFCTASTLSAGLAEDSREPTAYELSLSLTGGDVASYWRPTRRNYLLRLNRDRLLGLGAEMFGEEWAKRRSGYKKGVLADELHAAFASPEEHGRSPEEVERLRNWLPPGMAFGRAEPMENSAS